MASPVTVAQLLLSHCELMAAQGPFLPVAFPDVAFTPPEDGRYVRVDYFTNAPLWEGLSKGRIDQGLLQIMVVWPRDTGAIAIRHAVEGVMRHFPKGLSLIGASVRVKVSREPWAASPLVDDDKTIIPVTVSWTAS